MENKNDKSVIVNINDNKSHVSKKMTYSWFQIIAYTLASTFGAGIFIGIKNIAEITTSSKCIFLAVFLQCVLTLPNAITYAIIGNKETEGGGTPAYLEKYFAVWVSIAYTVLVVITSHAGSLSLAFRNLFETIGLFNFWLQISLATIIITFFIFLKRKHRKVVVQLIFVLQIIAIVTTLSFQITAAIKKFTIFGIDEFYKTFLYTNWGSSWSFKELFFSAISVNYLLKGYYEFNCFTDASYVNLILPYFGSMTILNFVYSFMTFLYLILSNGNEFDVNLENSFKYFMDPFSARFSKNAILSIVYICSAINVTIKFENQMYFTLVKLKDGMIIKKISNCFGKRNKENYNSVPTAEEEIDNSVPTAEEEIDNSVPTAEKETFKKKLKKKLKGFFKKIFDLERPYVSLFMIVVAVTLIGVFSFFKSGTIIGVLGGFPFLITAITFIFFVKDIYKNKESIMKYVLKGSNHKKCETFGLIVSWFIVIFAITFSLLYTLLATFRVFSNTDLNTSLNITSTTIQ